VATIDLLNLPHTVSIWKGAETIAADDTRRIQTVEYARTAQDITSLMQPVSAREKADDGYAYDQAIFRAWFTTAYALCADEVDSVVVWGLHAYRVLEWKVYDFGPVSVQHIEAMVERLPAMPDGVTA